MPKKPSMSDFEAFCSDPQLVNEPISRPWAIVYKALDGQPLDAEEVEICRALTSESDYSPREHRELVAVKGRRAQGTKTACKYLVFKIHTGNYQRFAPKGERLHVPIIAQTRDVAREIKAYLDGFYTNSPILAAEVEDILRNQIVLRSGFVLSVQTCSYRAPRGIAAPLGLCDELGVWRQEGSDIDREVVRSLTPAMVQFPNRRLILLGTPWVKAGVLFEAHERRAERSDRLVIHAPTALMNPLIPVEELDRERAADPANFRREFEGCWLDDVDQFLPDSDISAAVLSGVRELPPNGPLKGQYFGAIDASSLTGRDAFVFGIAHRGEGGRISLDLLRGWKRSPVTQVCDEVVALAKSYGLGGIAADQHGYAFLRELIAQRGIELRQLPFTARSKPEIFLSLKVALAQARLQLLDHTEALRELRLLESKRTSGGHYHIAAPRSQHDDYACVIAMLAHGGATHGRHPLVTVISSADPVADALERVDGSERLWERIN